MTVYKWKPGAGVKVPAQVAGDELERLRVFQNGRLESRDVVSAARDPDSPLHPAFDWDDAVAGEKWRVEQAGHMIRHLDVQVERPDGPPAHIRAFVSVVRDEDRSYTSTAHALSDTELRQQVVEQAWRDLEAWQKRHAELVEFGGVFAAIEQARGA